MPYVEAAKGLSRYPTKVKKSSALIFRQAKSVSLHEALHKTHNSEDSTLLLRALEQFSRLANAYQTRNWRPHAST
mgnify:FL=1